MTGALLGGSANLTPAQISDEVDSPVGNPNFVELCHSEVRIITLPGTVVNEGSEEYLASPVKKMSHLKFCRRLRRIHRQFIVGGLNGIA